MKNGLRGDQSVIIIPGARKEAVLCNYWKLITICNIAPSGLATSKAFKAFEQCFQLPSIVQWNCGII